MKNIQCQPYDVVIMGAGMAGICQARHLMLNVPNIKIALIDPRPEERTDKDLKVGESTVEISTLMICKELGLYDYMIENHPPKFGLNFNWAKDISKTEKTEDYYHLWSTRQPPLASVIVQRSKFERDVLKMNKEMGADFYNGRVVDVDLTSDDALNTVKVKLDGEYFQLQTKHVIDGAGRKFIVGRKKDNLIFGSENLHNLNNGSAWIRVKDVDQTIFHDGYDPTGATCSHYYATNHWMGHGHWVWMIPIDTQTKEVSVGLVHHHNVIPAQSVNTREKLYSFLETNHNVVYQLLKSGEEVDFHYLPRLAHKSKTMYSKDNWYVIGDAAAMFDPFYSMGMTMMSFEIENITEIIRAKLAGEANAEKKRVVYNNFAKNMLDRNNHLVSHHDKQLGNASVMTWRIFLENMWWFGILVPMFIGKWHLDLSFLNKFGKGGLGAVVAETLEEVYQQFNELVDKKQTNLGFMYSHRTDELPFNYSITKDFSGYIGLSKYEPKKINIYTEMKNTYFFVALWYLKFLWKGFGLKGFFKPKNIKRVLVLFKASMQSFIHELIYKHQTRNIPTNSKVAQQREEFKTYQYKSELLPWIETTPKSSLESTSFEDQKEERTFEVQELVSRS